MDTKKIVIASVVVLFLVIILLVWGLSKKESPPSVQNNVSTVPPAPVTTDNSTQPSPVVKGYTPNLPPVAELTKPKSEAPASANSALQSKARFFDMQATVNGFTPSSIIVNKGDTVYLNFSARDGDYDFDIPYLGAYFSVVKKGTMRRLPFDVWQSGTFEFACRDYCPPGKKIRGSIVVLPQQ